MTTSKTTSKPLAVRIRRELARRQALDRRAALALRRQKEDDEAAHRRELHRLEEVLNG